jgi:hypothetical protein
MRTNRSHVATVVAFALVIVLALTACNRGSQVTAAQAEEAFMVAFGGAYVGSMAAQFGQPLPGMEIDSEDNAVRFQDFDVTDLETEYTAISGSITATENAVDADFTLTDGPVETIAFTLSADEMSSQDGLRTTVTINGREMDIGLESEGPAEE